jgi:hypothetical protein
VKTVVLSFSLGDAMLNLKVRQLCNWCIYWEKVPDPSSLLLLQENADKRWTAFDFASSQLGSMCLELLVDLLFEHVQMCWPATCPVQCKLVNLVVALLSLNLCIQTIAWRLKMWTIESTIFVDGDDNFTICEWTCIYFILLQKSFLCIFKIVYYFQDFNFRIFYCCLICVCKIDSTSKINSTPKMRIVVMVYTYCKGLFLATYTHYTEHWSWCEQMVAPIYLHIDFIQCIWSKIFTNNISLTVICTVQLLFSCLCLPFSVSWQNSLHSCSQHHSCSQDINYSNQQKIKLCIKF